jgi:hypothetical protein
MAFPEAARPVPASTGNGPRKIDQLGGEVGFLATPERKEGGDARSWRGLQQQNGGAILEDVFDFVYPSVHAQVAHTLWIAHTHAMEAWESTPRIAFLSPEPASGKTRALEISVLLVPNPVEAINVTPAYLFRKVGSEEGLPTILYDEIDTVFGPKAKDNEEVRALLNAGHRRGAVAGRCVVHGKTVLTEEIPAYCAVALAGLGWLPETILSRSIIVQMRRRAPNEQIRPFRRRMYEKEGARPRDRLAAWGASACDHLANNWPELPASIADRDADVWEPIIALADYAGEAWPKRARDAAIEMVNAAKDREPSLGIRLLADLRAVFEDREAMTTNEILVDLIAIKEAPWGDLKGRPLNDRGLANRLRGYGVKSKQIRFGEKGLKGYDRADLVAAWERYLPLSSDRSETSETSTDKATEDVSAVSDDVSDETPESTNKINDVSDVSDVSLVAGNGGDPARGGEWTAQQVANGRGSDTPTDHLDHQGLLWLLGVDPAKLTASEIKTASELVRRISQCEQVPGSNNRRPAAMEAWQEFLAAHPDARAAQDRGSVVSASETFSPICEHCGSPERPDAPVLETWCDGEQAWLHRECRNEFWPDDLTIPPSLRRAP